MIDLSKMALLNRLAQVKKENNYPDSEVSSHLEVIARNKTKWTLPQVIGPRIKRTDDITFLNE